MNNKYILVNVNLLNNIIDSLQDMINYNKDILCDSDEKDNSYFYEDIKKAQKNCDKLWEIIEKEITK